MGVSVNPLLTERLTSQYAAKGNQLHVQAAYPLALEDTIGREFGALAGVRDNFPKYVVTLIDAKLPQDPFWLYHRF